MNKIIFLDYRVVEIGNVQIKSTETSGAEAKVSVDLSLELIGVEFRSQS